MAEPFTPTTEEVRESYQSTDDGLDFKRRFFERGEEFDRWLEQERRAAALKALEAAETVVRPTFTLHSNTKDDPIERANKALHTAADQIKKLRGAL